MLNPFPELLSYMLFAPFILRLMLAGYILHLHLPFLSKTASSKRHILSYVHIVFSVMLIVGFYTQIAALGFIVFSIGTYFYKKYKKEPMFLAASWPMVLSVAIAASLLLSGAGRFAIDLPL